MIPDTEVEQDEVVDERAPAKKKVTERKKMEKMRKQQEEEEEREKLGSSGQDSIWKGKGNPQEEEKE